jgi:hypothetical protein
MKTQEVEISGIRSVNVIMEDLPVGMEEVVVVGYGTQKKVNLTGSVSSITSDKLSVVPVANVSTLLYATSRD